MTFIGPYQFLLKCLPVLTLMHNPSHIKSRGFQNSNMKQPFNFFVVTLMVVVEQLNMLFASINEEIEQNNIVGL